MYVCIYKHRRTRLKKTVNQALCRASHQDIGESVSHLLMLHLVLQPQAERKHIMGLSGRCIRGKKKGKKDTVIFEGTLHSEGN